MTDGATSHDDATLNERQIAEIRAAVAAADAGGPFVRHPDVEDYMERLARDEHPERPLTFRR